MNKLKPIPREMIERAHLISDHEEALLYRVTEVFANCMRIAHQNKQCVGAKNDYYITLEQLERELLTMPKSF